MRYFDVIQLRKGKCTIIRKRINAVHAVELFKRCKEFEEKFLLTYALGTATDFTNLIKSAPSKKCVKSPTQSYEYKIRKSI